MNNNHRHAHAPGRRRGLVISVLLAGSLLAAADDATPEHPAMRPNVLFIMTDQQRWDALGCQDPRVQTPHLDALAARGTRYDQAVCQAPMCIPARYALKTGLYPSQVGVRNNAQAIHRPQDLPAPTVFARFRQAGWRTLGVGKTHWNIAPQPARGIPWPEDDDHGFDAIWQARMRGGFDIEAKAVCFSDDHYERMAWIRNYNKRTGSGGEGPLGYQGMTADGSGATLREHWLADRAIDAIREARRRRAEPHGTAAPWFCFLSFDAPHAPLLVPPEHEARYRLEDIPDLPTPPPGLVEHFPALAHAQDAYAAWQAMPALERRRTVLRYWALCSYADHEAGRVLEALRQDGDLERTVVVFTSDHGDSMGERGRFSKYSLYEGSVRVPLILAGPGVPAGVVDHRPAEHVDVVPTLMALAGLEVPQELPGEVLTQPGRRPGAFAEMYGNGNQEILQAPALMWRSGGWKLILHHPGDVLAARQDPDGIVGELYDLTADPGELVNRWADPSQRDRREAMTRTLLYQMAINHAVFPRHVSWSRTR